MLVDPGNEVLVNAPLELLLSRCNDSLDVPPPLLVIPCCEVEDLDVPPLDAALELPAPLTPPDDAEEKPTLPLLPPLATIPPLDWGAPLDIPIPPLFPPAVLRQRAPSQL